MPFNTHTNKQTHRTQWSCFVKKRKKKEREGSIGVKGFQSFPFSSFPALTKSEEEGEEKGERNGGEKGGEKGDQASREGEAARVMWMGLPVGRRGISSCRMRAPK